MLLVLVQYQDSASARNLLKGEEAAAIPYVVRNLVPCYNETTSHAYRPANLKRRMGTLAGLGWKVRI